MCPPDKRTTRASESILQGALDRDFVRVGRSGIHGRGVFAKRKIHEGARIIEYTGEHRPTTAPALATSQPDPHLVYSFRLNSKTVIDGTNGGNESRFINHSCEPNCTAYIFDARVYIYALREIKRGEELTFDYRLRYAGRTKARKADRAAYPCQCGAATCRGTLFSGSQRPGR